MGSISHEEYEIIKKTLENHLDIIISINKNIILQYYRQFNNSGPLPYSLDLELPYKIKNIIHRLWISASDFRLTEIWICFNHYILLSMKPNEFYDRLLLTQNKFIEPRIISIQRKWKEYYYHPDGPYLKTNIHLICERIGMKR